MFSVKNEDDCPANDTEIKKDLMSYFYDMVADKDKIIKFKLSDPIFELERPTNENYPDEN